MNPALEAKSAITNALSAFATQPLAAAATTLLESLGYRSQKRLALVPNTPANFLATFAQGRPLNPQHALIADWQSVDFLFQLTDDEIRAAAGGNQQLLFDSKGKYNGAAMESYLFFAIALKKAHYTRTELSGITRAVNRLFRMPAMLLFKHGDTLTLAVINRRLHKREESKDVLEKVTLIKDIRFACPHRAHVEILYDLSFEALRKAHDFSNFVTLHAAWQKTLDTSELNKRFFQEIANWYFWACDHVVFPMPKGTPNPDAYKAQSLIRLITRLIFCWFVKEKGLIPEELFDPRALAGLLNDGAKLSAGKGSAYYKAILQNLFFATLNQEMLKRAFRKRSKDPHGRDPHRGITNLYRYEDLFADPKTFLRLMAGIPFLNGGLFECLDKVYRTEEGLPDIRIDGFSDHPKNPLSVPDFLFFGGEQTVDLSAAYGEKRYRQATVRGLIHTFNHYKFTITENTPLDQEVALDPELSGKVFENLLAAYNPETATTARKQTGSFYTPREIVDYMVDEALIAYLGTALDAPQKHAENTKMENQDAEAMRSLRSLAANSSVVEKKLRHLLSYTDEPHQFSPAEVQTLIAAIDNLKALDPACGSGAFPMGLLHKLVFILGKLDPHNEQWKQKQIAKAGEIPDATIREKTLADIEQAFAAGELDYGRKLYLIENCIYGVDIQPIAVQIAKMRFFISLVVDQKVDPAQPNLGVRPLPNLETKFVAANTLIGIEKPAQQLLRNPAIDAKEAELRQVRERHFTARTPATKARCRELDAKLRAEISELLRADGFARETTEKLAHWNPYDQNASADFFDPEWMFGIRDGFDIVIGNPPYVRIQTLTAAEPAAVAYYKQRYVSASKGNYDLYVVFVERSLQLLQPRGHLAYILPHKFFNAQYGQPLRELLAGGRHLRHVVHFGDQQIFPGATNYVCLLFLAKAGADACRWVRADDLPAWLATQRAPETALPAARLTPAEWNFAVGPASSLFDKLQRMPVKLGQLAERISQGIRTSANEVYVLDVVSERSGLVTARSKQLDKEVVLERRAVSRFLAGREIKAYSIQPSGKVVIIPYELRSGKSVLIPTGELEDHCPKTAAYLRANKKYLEAREDGRMQGTGWHGFIYPKNLDVMKSPKLLVPDIADRAAFALDENGEFAFTSGYGITFKPGVKESPKYLLGLLNSRLLDWFWKRVSTPLRGGFYRYFTQFIEQLPIRPIDFGVAAERAERDALVKLVDQILAAKRANPAADVSAWEREIDERVYRLYGLTPEEIKLVEEGASK
jgi:adenine-specific DNA-methyltransferase